MKWWVGWAAILIVSLGLQVWPLVNNNFYFTVDQGRDAVYVREILNYGTVFLKGPEASIRGVFTGPGWYYFLAPGYWLTSGHPAGGILALTVLNLVVLGALMRTKGLKVGLLLLFFWPFYEANRYAFNPFLLVPLAIIFGLALERKKLIIGLLMVFLAYNAHLFGAAVFAGVWLIAAFVKKINWYTYSGLLALGCLVGYVVSPVWREWYIVFLWPVLLITIAPKLNKAVLLGAIILELIYFAPRYFGQWNNQDTGILKNQLAVMDWIYENESHRGLYVYNFTDRFYDYPYQYLFWWHGKNKYGHLPCEYSNFPGSNKINYVPHYERYTTPQSGCDQPHRYLIIESPSNGEANSTWIEDYRTTTTLLVQTAIGKTQIEKRAVTPLFSDRYNTGYLPRDYRDNALQITIPGEWKLEHPDHEQFKFSNSDGSITGLALSLGKSCPDYYTDDVNTYSLRSPGQKNDYLIVIKTAAVMARADKLRDQILHSVKTFEDDGTKIQTRCF